MIGWVDNVKEERSDVPQAAECAKTDCDEKIRLCRPIIANLQAKTDG